MQNFISWALGFDGFRAASILMYAFFATGLFWLGLIHHKAKVSGDKEVKQYPKGYFTLLAVQLIPLLVTGFVIGDIYIIGTRLTTLVVVFIVFGITSSADGTFVTRKHWLSIFTIVIVAMFGGFVWSDSEQVRALVHDFEKWIAWGSVAVMILFVFRGQSKVGVELFVHFVRGNYSIKRLSLQFVRFFGFFFQAVAYWLVPSKAEPLLGLDPIFLQGAIGTFGVSLVLIMAFIGFIGGSGARRIVRYRNTQAALAR